MTPVHLLIIEDLEEDALLLLREVRRGGYDVNHLRVDSPPALIAALEKQAWDLVISDFSMPHFSGTDALKLIRSRGLETPFIFVSGTLGEETAVEALQNGAQDYLIKGNLKRLIPAIQRELREAEARRERRRLEQQVHQLQKFEAIGRLAGGIAHDFNNVLGAILGWAELAYDEVPPECKARQTLEHIRNQAERAAVVTAQLLAFARRQVLQRKKVGLNALVEEGIKLLRTTIGEQIEVSISLAQDLMVVVADPAQLDQVLMNLCLNARDAMPHGGRLTITTENVEVGKDLAASIGMPPGHYAVLSVADTGVGMDAKTLDKIFEPFFTTKEVGKGTGLGLATVYGIAHQHGGTIQCESKPGHGTVFRVFLPAVAGPAEERTAKNLPAPRRGHETILLAEDHDGLRESGRNMLEALGYRVLAASSGAEAVECFRQHRDEIDVVIMDVVMPTLSGPEAHGQILAIRPDAKVIFTTGYASGTTMPEAIHNTGAPLLQKPYTLAKLTYLIGQVLATS